MKKKLFNLKRHCQRQVYDERKEKTISGVTLILCFFLFSTASAQEVVNSSGGEGSGSGGTVSYSIGNTVYSTNSEAAGTVAQGVQHPYEIFVVTGIDDVPGIDLILSAYPNPVTDYLTLKVEDEKLKGMSYQLYNLEGRLLVSNKLVENETHISMKQFKPATYLLKVMNKNSEIKTFKIIKK